MWEARFCGTRLWSDERKDRYRRILLYWFYIPVGGFTVSMGPTMLLATLRDYVREHSEVLRPGRNRIIHGISMSNCTHSEHRNAGFATICAIPASRARDQERLLVSQAYGIFGTRYGWTLSYKPRAVQTSQHGDWTAISPAGVAFRSKVRLQKYLKLDAATDRKSVV